jgi:predicted MFS family arabinose efflux permease
VFGWILAAHQIGAGTGALAAGIVRTEVATYTPAWLGAGLLCLAAAVVVLRIGRRTVTAVAAPLVARQSES